MVDQQENNDLIIQSEASQTAFEGQQTFMQPPPVVESKHTKKKKWVLIGVSLFVVFVILLISLASRVNDQVVITKKPEASPSPTPIYIDPAKENELKRVESIVNGTNPEDLLIAPPQVDMQMSF